MSSFRLSGVYDSQSMEKGKTHKVSTGAMHSTINWIGRMVVERCFPENTKHLYNIYATLAKRFRRWSLALPSETSIIFGPIICDWGIWKKVF